VGKKEIDWDNVSISWQQSRYGNDVKGGQVLSADATVIIVFKQEVKTSSTSLVEVN